MKILEVLILEFVCSLDSLEPIHRIEEELILLLEKNKIGTLDGHEIAEDCSHGTLILYDEDAKKLLEEIAPTLKNANFLTFTYGNIRLMSSESKNVRFKLNL